MNLHLSLEKCLKIPKFNKVINLYFGGIFMSIVAYRPSEFWREMSNYLDNLTENKKLKDSSLIETVDWSPVVDIKENEDNFVIYADLPGVSKEDIEIAMESNVLTIKGERKKHHDAKHKGYFRSERVIGTFYRRFTLPETADANNIKAKTEKGVLEIIISKKEIAKPRLIKVDGE
jgi:HSP20 family protein